MAEVLEEKIQELLSSRTELADRLANLEKLKAETNERVYKRIRQGYQDQLDSVLSSISAERGTLEGKVADLKKEIDLREKRYTEESDKVDELNLRAKLKEYDANDGSFRTELEDARRSRAATGGELERLRSELGDLNKVLKDVDEATSARKSAASSKSAREVQAEEPVELEIDEEIEDSEGPGSGSGGKCPSCGHVNPPQKLFCENCGNSLDEEEPLDEDFDLVDDDLDL
jgi:chromosome segregation ATPase